MAFIKKIIIIQSLLFSFFFFSFMPNQSLASGCNGLPLDSYKAWLTISNISDVELFLSVRRSAENLGGVYFDKDYGVVSPQTEFVVGQVLVPGMNTVTLQPMGEAAKLTKVFTKSFQVNNECEKTQDKSYRVKVTNEELIDVKKAEALFEGFDL